MHRGTVVGFLLGLLVANLGLANIPAYATISPISNHEKKLRQAIEGNRSFQLPNAQILNQATSALGMEHFLEKTGLIDKIANRHLKETGIYLAVDLAFYDYAKYLKNNMQNNMPHPMLEMITTLEMMKPLLIDTIIRVSKKVPDEQ